MNFWMSEFGWKEIAVVEILTFLVFFGKMNKFDFFKFEQVPHSKASQTSH
jgi:hypothetical protein